ncbi:voltage-dependent potassium channel, beta subunit [Gigaspora margarita]|uniref:Voltage-dependent potassium channel, beta subunit n=1 Tax=Gigaspora margarita TaxID=4874 RepID=A0A8H3XDJ8_GIGMA|nr:voltage-dependent potassium channel, beta subunit [Gigaspora margarita]
MEYRYLGHSGLKVSVLSLGGWVNFGRVSPDVTLKCMQVAFENGINYFDTAEVYDGGKSEIDMGNAIKKLGWKRSDFVISTKLFWGGKGPNDRGLSRKHIIEGLNASLKRLELDYVDIVYAHRPDPDTPMTEIVRAFNHVINQGKAFYWGTSEWPAHQIVEAYGVANQLLLIPPLAEQTQYNLFHRERVEQEYMTLFKEFKMGAAVWSPLAGGILTGKHNERIAEDSRLALEGNAVMQRLREGLLSEEGKIKIEKIKRLRPIADKVRMSPAQLAIAWCIKQTNINTVITGASKPEQIEENIQAVKLVGRLTPDILEEIESILKNRLPPEFNFRDC